MRAWVFLGGCALLFAGTGCNVLFGIEPGETGGSGGTTATGGTTTTSGDGGTTTTSGDGGTTTTSGDGGTTTTTTGGTGGAPSCTPKSATCEGAVLHACDDAGFPLPDQTCDAVAGCDAAAGKCLDPDAFGRVSVGAGRGCVIEDDRSLRCWGVRGGGAVFVNPPVIQASAIEVPDVSARMVSAGYRDQFALQNDGTIIAWGDNDYGQLGVPESSAQLPFTIPDITDAVEVRAGDGCTCARHQDGAVSCWGAAKWGCLGTTDQIQENQPAPTKVPGVAGAVQIAMWIGSSPQCARLADGTVSCWNETIPPTVVPGVDDAIDVAVGYQHVLIRSASKGLLWSAPTANGLDWRTAFPYANGTFTELSASVEALGLRSDGKLYAGPLGNSAIPSPPSQIGGVPAGTIVELASGCDANCYHEIHCLRLGGVALSDGVYCWGDDSYGGLGIGGPDYVSTPQDVPGIGPMATLFASHKSTSGVQEDGTVVFWGRATGLGGITSAATSVAFLDNDNADVSTDDIADRAYVRKTNGTMLLLDGGAPQASGELINTGITDFVKVRGCDRFAAGIRATGELVVYANFADANVDGILGDGSTTCMADQFVTVPNLTGVTQMAPYGDDYNSWPSHICALLTGGALKCWGHNYWGEVGDGTFGGDGVATPHTVTINGGEPVLSIAAGAEFNCAVVQSGKVYCWGWNDLGQLGLPGLPNQALPTLPVVGISNATAVTAWHDHACALLADKTVKCWGDGSLGVLGDGSFVVSATPVVVDGLTNVAQVVAGRDHVCARRDNGTVACWGSSYDGQVGTGKTGYFSTPEHVLGL
ncbi:MAG: hypothetical protein U0441_12305 [Polyangiaceae bacterium]